ncbi:MAG: PKD domain-containing protein [Chloroflexi bacterium]|nr:MAG: PKD domain-containing protein [Chloroflexota bacterium]
MDKKWSLVFVFVLAVSAVSVLVGSLRQGVSPTAVSPTTLRHLPPSTAEMLSVADPQLETWQQQILAQEYQATWQKDTTLMPDTAVLQAPNRANHLRTYFLDNGIVVTPRTETSDMWHIGLELVAYGYGSSLTPATAVLPQPAGTRVLYTRPELTEWYINDHRGIEQGFTLFNPPSRTAETTFRLQYDIETALLPYDTGQGIQFMTADGRFILNYTGLHAFDSQNTPLPATMRLIPGHKTAYAIELTVATAAAHFPVTIDPVLTPAPGWTQSIAQNADFGFSVASAGDVNGDGFPDIIIGAPRYDGGQADTGAAFIYYGTAFGPGNNPAHILEGSKGAAFFGTAVNTAGDVNNDDIDDILISNGLEEVFLFLGSTTGPAATPTQLLAAPVPGSAFGQSLDTAGDVNGDGFDDIIIGAPAYAGTMGVNQGRAYVYYGSSTGVIEPFGWSAEGPHANDYFAWSVADAGDVNGDTYDDVIISIDSYAPVTTPLGAAVVFHGSSTGLPDPNSDGKATITEANWLVVGSQANSLFGFSVNAAGDVNGDTYDDVIIGAPAYTGTFMQEGAAFIFTGSPTGLASDPFWSITGGKPGSGFGTSVASAGDINGDGYDDVVVGAPTYLTGAGPLPEGIFRAYLGAPISMSPTPFMEATGAPDSLFGHVVASADDINNDGAADILVGAPGYTTTANFRGQAFVYYGIAPISSMKIISDGHAVMGQPTKLTALAVGSPPFTFTWNLGDDNFALGATIIHTYTNPGLYTIYVTATNPVSTKSISATLAVAVESSINPDTGGSVSFVDGSGRGVNVGVPGGAVTNAVRMTYTPVEKSELTQPEPAGGLGYYFDLSVVPPNLLYLPVIVKNSSSLATAGEENNLIWTPPAHANAATRNTDSYFFLKPITVTVVYPDSLVVGQDETKLKLEFWDTAQQMWIDAATSCSPVSTYNYDPANNRFTLQVCHLTRFGLVGAN